MILTPTTLKEKEKENSKITNFLCNSSSTPCYKIRKNPTNPTANRHNPMLKHPKPPIPPQPIHIPISHPPTQKSNLYKPNPPKTLKNNSSPPHQAHPQLPRNGTDRRPIKTTPHENTHIPKASRTGSRAEQRGAHLRGSGRRRWRRR